jgi:pyruvate formate lyase activating enzyme
MQAETGLIFDIQGYSVHDGPGTRTLIFLNGCPLRCTWCANPEGQKIRQCLMYKPQFCKSCPLRCVDSCPAHAVTRSSGENGLVQFDRSLCDLCGSMECLKSCYMRALQRSGKWYGVEEVMAILGRDRDYWGPKGGVTLSGGEPLMQNQFATALLRRCHESFIDTCVETSGHVSRKVLQEVAQYVQWFFIDVKHMDPARHRDGTGVGNQTILDNIRWLCSNQWSGRLLLRMPVIPGFNDTEQNAEATLAFLKECGLNEINLLPFHRLGASKHSQLGSRYEFEEQAAMKPEELEPLAAIYRRAGVQCYLGSDTPF